MGKIKSVLLTVYNFVLDNLPALKTWFGDLKYRFLPVKKNRIVFSSFCGSNCSCNPKAVFEYLLKNYKDKFEYVWLFDFNSNPEIPEEVKKNAKCVQFNSDESDYYKAASGVWCFNHRNTQYFHKKKNQLYIQTWHGDIGFKAIEKKTCVKPEDFESPYIKKCIKDSKFTDIVLSGSQWGYDNMKESFFYDGEILKCGYPRNDVLFNESNDELREKIRTRYGVPSCKKICLYAPTFRAGFNVNEVLFNEDNTAGRVSDALTERFGGEWVLFMKYHPASINKYETKDFMDGKTVFDISDYPDTADLLAGCDALISDYSSVSFDFALTYKPCWLYFEDFESYRKNDRNIIIDTDKIGFDMCADKDALIFAIKNFDKAEYDKKIKKMFDDFGSCENGTACSQVAQRIVDFVM